MKPKALFIRLDRMGDLVLSLPCDHLVSDQYDVHWLVPKGLDFVVEATRPQRNFSTSARTWSWKTFFEFLNLVNTLKPKVAICFHVPWWIPMALFVARVPLRGGVLSQWHSYLFLNKGLRQKRSRCEQHEMEYNYLLTEYVFDLPKDKSQWTPLQMKAPENFKAFSFDRDQKYFVVHPGMGGSALNWPTDQYYKVIDDLSHRAQVVITGTAADLPYINPLKQKLKDNPRVTWLDQQLDGSQLLNLLNDAIAILAPSTGVLHLSASLGAPSLGIYSPILVHQARRWGPKGPQAWSFSPQVQCPSQFECLGKKCPHFFCMEGLETGPVVEKALSFLN
ncbi:MAG: glycosyltransferase family 9 protein [Bdellovibrionales bacterium]|nr:glycosyltransferase family 9 protein [Bdellovibrionales bacterium]